MNRHRFGPWWKTLVRFLFAKRICIFCTFCKYSSRGITLYHQRVAGQMVILLLRALAGWIQSEIITVMQWCSVQPCILAAMATTARQYPLRSTSEQSQRLNESVLFSAPVSTERAPVPEAFAACRNNLARLWASEHASIPITQGCKPAISSGSPIRDILVLTKAVYHLVNTVNSKHIFS